MNTEDVLGKAPLFAALDRESAAALRTSITEVQLAKGQTLFHENETGDRLYVVLDGKIKLSRTSPDGRGSNSDSSPNISLGPSTLRRFSRPSGEVRDSLILPSSTT